MADVQATSCGLRGLRLQDTLRTADNRGEWRRIIHSAVNTRIDTMLCVTIHRLPVLLPIS